MNTSRITEMIFPTMGSTARVTCVWTEGCGGEGRGGNKWGEEGISGERRAGRQIGVNTKQLPDLYN